MPDWLKKLGEYWKSALNVGGVALVSWLFAINWSTLIVPPKFIAIAGVVVVFLFALFLVKYFRKRPLYTKYVEDVIYDRKWRWSYDALDNPTNLKAYCPNDNTPLTFTIERDPANQYIVSRCDKCKAFGAVYSSQAGNLEPEIIKKLALEHVEGNIQSIKNGIQPPTNTFILPPTKISPSMELWELANILENTYKEPGEEAEYYDKKLGECFRKAIEKGAFAEKRWTGLRLAIKSDWTFDKIIKWFKFNNVAGLEVPNYDLGSIELWITFIAYLIRSEAEILQHHEKNAPRDYLDIYTKLWRSNKYAVFVVFFFGFISAIGGLITIYKTAVEVFIPRQPSGIFQPTSQTAIVHATPKTTTSPTTQTQPGIP
jgi:hypothetical protein